MMRFGSICSWQDGQTVFAAGGNNPGVLLQGQIRISQCDGMGNNNTIVDHGPGEFTAEVGQLSGAAGAGQRACAGAGRSAADSDRRHARLVVAEAELGERIMRALILRRVGLIEAASSAPVLVGPPGSAGLFGLQSFLSANGHPHMVLDPATSANARP
ncbi:hypothetical protein LP420_08505 [Massilia sp. B-10]|nr:hypothetical protein LP420_08505 [Massilia sp. B-10]